MFIPRVTVIWGFVPKQNQHESHGVRTCMYDCGPGLCQQTGCWIDVTVIWNGKVPWRLSERRSTLPSRTCLRARRSSGSSPAPVGHRHTDRWNLSSSSSSVWMLTDVHPLLDLLDRHSLLSLLADCGDPEGNWGILQEHLWQIFISEDEGEDEDEDRLCIWHIFRSEEVSLGRVPRLLNHVGDPKIKNLNSVFVSQDWQEIVALYETDNVYLGECYVTSRGNVSFSVCNTQHETHESSVFYWTGTCSNMDWMHV